MAYADYRKTRVKRSEEEKTEYSISHVRHLIKNMPERCLNNFEAFYKANKRGLDTLVIFNKDDLRNYINGIEA